MFASSTKAVHARTQRAPEHTSASAAGSKMGVINANVFAPERQFSFLTVRRALIKSSALLFLCPCPKALLAFLLRELSPLLHAILRASGKMRQCMCVFPFARASASRGVQFTAVFCPITFTCTESSIKIALAGQRVHINVFKIDPFSRLSGRTWTALRCSGGVSLESQEYCKRLEARITRAGLSFFS